MKKRLKKRQKDILRALRCLGGRATTREIATQVGLNVNGVSQSLGALGILVANQGGRGGDIEWKLVLIPDELLKEPRLDL